MTAQIMARPRPGTAGNDEANRRLGQHLLDVVRRQDAAIPAERRARRTVAEMRTRLAERMADDACGVCGFWRCRCGGQSTAAARPVPARSTGTEATR
ncbi:hypothetical protein J8N05_47040 (plasmid) [Streptomyces sp. BH-SS-21]|uniref:Uncharacterized protein n=1 Tax=Streptomyces liliiviolaceus TaxID=2823109 RepID=A0A941BEX7_9ACTN|nr:hypothetical protein [Streptomyces liliiviolaceus]MBQ0855718.1 hypothetical protein [Streptomyces liliiviolaceus]